MRSLLCFFGLHRFRTYKDDRVLYHRHPQALGFVYQGCTRCGWPRWLYYGEIGGPPQLYPTVFVDRAHRELIRLRLQESQQ